MAQHLTRAERRIILVRERFNFHDHGNQAPSRLGIVKYEERFFTAITARYTWSLSTIAPSRSRLVKNWPSRSRNEWWHGRLARAMEDSNGRDARSTGTCELENPVRFAHE